MGGNLNDFFLYFFSPLQVIHHVSAKANDEGAACKATEVSPAHCFHSGFNSCHCIQGERMTHTQAATNTTLMVMLRLKKWHSRDERNTSSVLSVSRSTYSSADSWSYFIHHIYFLVKLLFFRSVYKMQWIVHLKDMTFLMLTNKYSNIIVFFLLWPVLLFCIVSILLSLLILWVVSVISVVILILPAVSSVIFLLLFPTVHGDRAQETGVRRLLQAVRCHQRLQRHEGSWGLWECAAHWEVKPRWGPHYLALNIVISNFGIIWNVTYDMMVFPSALTFCFFFFFLEIIFLV